MMLSILFLLITQSVWLIGANDCSNTICSPKAGDLLIGRGDMLSATSTCGLKTIEKYCVVTGNDRSNNDGKCENCDSRSPYDQTYSRRSHHIQNVISKQPRDNLQWWQSENGVDNVTIQVDFETAFQFSSTLLRFRTYRPKSMVIEHSNDYGTTWKAYAYFSDFCEKYFPHITIRPRKEFTDVNCDSRYSSIIPSEGGTVSFTVNPYSTKFRARYEKKTHDATMITNLRIRFLKLHKFGDSILGRNRDINNKYYYAINEWIVTGRCLCYGHADKCTDMGSYKKSELKIKVLGHCLCQHNTAGKHCEKCQDFYNDLPWRPAEPTINNECKKCNCNDHSNSCHFNAVLFQQSNYTSGGFCDNCLHNTEGKNCERCQGGYYRNSNVAINHLNTCIKCKCNSKGNKYKDLCIQEADPDNGFQAGQCICSPNIGGFYCDKCKTGFYNFDMGCKQCRCMMSGTRNNTGCHQTTGKCICKNNVKGQTCSICKKGYFGLSAKNPLGCRPCDCSKNGSIDYMNCDINSGQCTCKQGYGGRTCGGIQDEWFVRKVTYPLTTNMTEISLLPVPRDDDYNFILIFDTKNVSKDAIIQVQIKVENIPKKNCQQHVVAIPLIKNNNVYTVSKICLSKDKPILFKFKVIQVTAGDPKNFVLVDVIVVPEFDSKTLNPSREISNCIINNVNTPLCKHVKSEIYNIHEPIKEPKQCKCNITGSFDPICAKVGGQCNCRPNVNGRKCDECSQGSYGFDALGCIDCKCDKKGSINQRCSAMTGKCECKSNVIGIKCEKCKSGYYRHPDCVICQCNYLSETCDKDTGKCIGCRGNTFGFNCQQCNKGYYGNPEQNITCSECMCPGLDLGLDHSEGCNLVEFSKRFKCRCKRGYTGDYCDQCDVNYYGNPTEKNGKCKACDCSGNIDVNDVDNCDSSSGKCLKCLYDTAGFNCEKCAPGFYGNGAQRTCQKCTCNNLGTNQNVSLDQKCDSITGQCNCLPNVIGQSCDRCMDNYFNFTSGKGCQPCQCDYPVGANSTKCNNVTGNCDCKKGRSGLKCDQCPEKYWGIPNFTSCKKCQCNMNGSISEQCDQIGGFCRCKPGVTGTLCDKCITGIKVTDKPCKPCGECWDYWNKRINNIYNEKIDMLEVATTNHVNSSEPITEYLDLLRKFNEIDVPDDFMKKIPEYTEALKQLKSYPKINLDSMIAKLSKVHDDLKLQMKSLDAEGDYSYDITKRKFEAIKENVENQKKMTDRYINYLKKVHNQFRSMYEECSGRRQENLPDIFNRLMKLFEARKKALNNFRELMCYNGKCSGEDCDLKRCMKPTRTNSLSVISIRNEIKTLLNSIKYQNSLISRMTPLNQEKVTGFKNVLGALKEYNSNVFTHSKKIADLDNQINMTKDLVKSVCNVTDFTETLDTVKNYWQLLNHSKLRENLNKIKKNIENNKEYKNIIKDHQQTKNKIKKMLEKTRSLLETVKENTVLGKQYHLELLHNKTIERVISLDAVKHAMQSIKDYQDNSAYIRTNMKKLQTEIENIHDSTKAKINKAMSTSKDIESRIKRLNELKERLSKDLPKTKWDFQEKERKKLIEIDIVKNQYLQKINQAKRKLKNSESFIKGTVKTIDEWEQKIEEKSKQLLKIQVSISEKARHQRICLA